MHELAVTESILEIALRHAETANATAITDIYLVIGQLSSIIDDSVAFYWDLISKETIAAGAEIHFRRIPAKLRCEECDHIYTPEAEFLACPKCGGMKIIVVKGDEFLLESIAVES
jgi:hydrogenase nickel incorporation protein HypA/HybF